MLAVLAWPRALDMMGSGVPFSKSSVARECRIACIPWCRLLILTPDVLMAFCMASHTVSRQIPVYGGLDDTKI